MKKVLLAIILLVTPLLLAAREIPRELDSLYQALDEAIDKSQQYIAARRATTDGLKNRLAATADKKKRMQLCSDLYEIYRSVSRDSAFLYIDQAHSLAQQLGDNPSATLYEIKKAFLCATLGMYSEGLDILSSIDENKLQGELLGQYALSAQHVYGEMAYYCDIDSMKQEWQQRADRYMPLILNNLPEDDDDRLLRLEMQYFGQGNNKKALEVNDRRMRLITPGSREMAVVAFYRYLDLREAGDSIQAEKWLLEAALQDVRHGVMDQGAMWEIANKLNSRGDLERSYRYINFTWNCAQQLGTRMRAWQFTPVLAAADESYREMTHEANTRLRWFVVIVSLLSVLFLAAALYVNSQRHKLAEAKHQLDNRNATLAELNNQLSDSNGQLTELNKQMQDVIGQLATSNRDKEEYIGRFFTLCSTYVDRLDKLRTRVTKGVKNREYQEVLKLTADREAKNRDLDDLYINFDSTFLKLYPRFVEQFNDMLQPEARIDIQEGKLTTTLRIFALIRLGIEDSGRIAEFLHYSVNTYGAQNEAYNIRCGLNVVQDVCL